MTEETVPNKENSDDNNKESTNAMEGVLNALDRVTSSIARKSGTAGVHENARPKRIPVSGNRDILSVHGKEKGFVYRWVNDKGNAIAKFKAAGYEPVTHTVTVGQLSVNATDQKGGIISVNVGGSTTAFLMRIKEEWYKEDQAAKQVDIDAMSEDIYRTLNDKEDGKYGSVSIQSRKSTF